MRRDGGLTLTLLCLLSEILDSTSLSAPGSPKLTSCRSPEKETFTCWWEPGSSGGLPTSHQLYYTTENSDQVYECPDYHSVGENSCFFDKRHTSIWVNYNISVVASNALGNTRSDPVEVDVMDIIQPHTPENVTVTLLGAKESPYFLVQWEPPRDADTRSGWVTLTYELRVKQEKENEWEEYSSGKQKHFSIYSLHSGQVYLVQVRCKLDQGLWSEWSTPTYMKVPHYIPTERSVWLFTAIFTGFVFLVITGILAVKRKYVKHCLLPPVPGPKIKGFDTQLLKRGRPEEIYSALISPGFPPTSDSKDPLVECLVVFDSDDNSELDGREPLERQKKSKRSSDVRDSSAPVAEERCDELREYVEGRQCQVTDRKLARPAGRPSLPRIQKPVHRSSAAATQKAPIKHTHTPPNKHPDHSTTNSQSNCNSKCNSDQNRVNVAPAGVVEYVEVEKETRVSRQTLTPAIDEGQDYSKVGEIVSDGIVLLQQESNAILGHQGEKCTQQKQSKRHKTAPLTKRRVMTETQDYVETTGFPFS